MDTEERRRCRRLVNEPGLDRYRWWKGDDQVKRRGRGYIFHHQATEETPVLSLSTVVLGHGVQSLSEAA